MEQQSYICLLETALRLTFDVQGWRKLIWMNYAAIATAHKSTANEQIIQVFDFESNWLGQQSESS